MKLTVKDAAALLDVSEKTIYRWIKQQTVPFYRINDQYRFNRAELLEWATSRKSTVTAEILSDPEDQSIRLPSLSEALEAGGVFYRIEGDGRDDVLANVVDHLRVPEEVDKEFLLKTLITREEMGSTGIGDGIALPHARNPVVQHLTRATVTLCFLEHPVDFGSLDGSPVNILFTIVAPTSRSHLHLLSRLAFALRDPGLKSVLKEQGRREELFREVRRVESEIEKNLARQP